MSLLALAISADAASARKRIRLPMFISTPGAMTGGVVKVQELPDVPMLQRADGVYLDLGYRHTGAGTGEWVGYVGSSTKYLPLSEEGLKGLMLVAGLKELPPPPSRSSGGGLVWLGVLVLAGCFGLLKKLAARVSQTAARVSEQYASPSNAPGTADWVKRAQYRVEDERRSARPALSPQRPMRPMAVSQQTAAGGAARSGFGRRS